MNPMSRLHARWAQLFRRTDPVPDIEQELRAFVDERTDQGIAAGLAPDEARRRAQVEVGGVGPMTQKLRDQRAGCPSDAGLPISGATSATRSVRVTGRPHSPWWRCSRWGWGSGARPRCSA